jgi:hypothetical protein
MVDIRTGKFSHKRAGNERKGARQTSEKDFNTENTEDTENKERVEIAGR